MCQSLIFVKKKNIFYIFFTIFLALFSTLPSTQNFLGYHSNFFQWAGLIKLGFEHAFQPYTYSLRLFSMDGGRGTPPTLRLYIDYRVNKHIFSLIIVLFRCYHGSLESSATWDIRENCFSPGRAFSTWTTLGNFIMVTGGNSRTTASL